MKKIPQPCRSRIEEGQDLAESFSNERIRDRMRGLLHVGRWPSILDIRWSHALEAGCSADTQKKAHIKQIWLYPASDSLRVAHWSISLSDGGQPASLLYFRSPSSYTLVSSPHDHTTERLWQYQQQLLAYGSQRTHCNPSTVGSNLRYRKKWSSATLALLRASFSCNLFWY